MSSLLSSPQVFQNGLEFSELKRALCLHKQVAFSSIRAVEKELEGKKCNTFVASGSAGKITKHEGSFCICSPKTNCWSAWCVGSTF